MEDRITIHLTGPAKINGQWRKVGEDVPVTPELALELVAAGVIERGDDIATAELAPGMPGYDEAVAAMAKTLADAAVEAAVAAALAGVVSDRDAARIRASDAEDAHRRAEARVLELEAELHEVQTALDAATAKTAAPATDEAEPVAAADDGPETAPKKGARAKKG